MRTDSLYLFDWTFLGEPVRVSQALSILLAVLSAFMLFYNIKIRRRSPEDLLVRQLERQTAEAPDNSADPDASQTDAESSSPDVPPQP